MTTQPPVEIAVAVVRRNDAVLIGRRPQGKPLAGYWEFPGGKIRAHESPREAAVRECLEEAGIAIGLSGTATVVDYAYDYATLRLHFFDAAPLDPETPPLPPFQWIPMAELDVSAFPPANAAVIRRLRDGP